MPSSKKLILISVLWASSKVVAMENTGSLRLNLGVEGSYLAAGVGYSESSSTGIAYGASASATVELVSRFHAMLGAGFQTMKLSRLVEGTGVLEDPGFAVSQSIDYVTTSVQGGYCLWKSSLGDRPSEKIEWWWDGGLQFFFPISATQSDPFLGHIPFNSTDHPMLAALGISAIFAFDTDLGLTSGLFATYNVAASGGSGLLGVRLNLALSVAML